MAETVDTCLDTAPMDTCYVLGFLAYQAAYHVFGTAPVPAFALRAI